MRRRSATSTRTVAATYAGTNASVSVQSHALAARRPEYRGSAVGTAVPAGHSQANVVRGSICAGVDNRVNRCQPLTTSRTPVVAGRHRAPLEVER